MSKTRGGWRPLLDNVQKEAAFFSGLLPLINQSINQSVNESVNDESVCRTGPASPGLFNSMKVWHVGATFRVGTWENTCLWHVSVPCPYCRFIKPFLVVVVVFFSHMNNFSINLVLPWKLGSYIKKAFLMVTGNCSWQNRLHNGQLESKWGNTRIFYNIIFSKLRWRAKSDLMLHTQC